MLLEGVRFDAEGRPTAWSEPARWTMGLLKPEEWKARWIGAEKEAGVVANASSLGYHAAEASSADDVKWVQVDLGQPVTIQSVRLHALTHDGVAGFGFPVRFSVTGSNDVEFKTFSTIADHTTSDYPSPGHAAISFDGRGISARYVRVTATRSRKKTGGSLPFGFALAEMEVFSEGKNAALHREVSAKDSVEGSGWSKAQLTDGLGLAEGTIESKIGKADGAQPPLNSLPIFRRSFVLSKPLLNATAYVCGLGQHELHVNGQKVGDGRHRSRAGPTIARRAYMSPMT